MVGKGGACLVMHPGSAGSGKHGIDQAPGAGYDSHDGRHPQAALPLLQEPCERLWPTLPRCTDLRAHHVGIAHEAGGDKGREGVGGMERVKVAALAPGFAEALPATGGSSGSQPSSHPQHPHPATHHSLTC